MNPDSQHALKALVEKAVLDGWGVGEEPHPQAIINAVLAVLRSQPPAPTREMVAMACCKAWEGCGCDKPCAQVTGYKDIPHEPDNDDPMDFKKMADAVLALYADAAPTQEYEPMSDASCECGALVRHHPTRSCPGPVAAPQERCGFGCRGTGLYDCSDGQCEVRHPCGCAKGRALIEANPKLAIYDLHRSRTTGA